MIRGGWLRSIAIGALIGLSFLLPAATRASTPVTLTLTVTPSTAFEDQDVTLSVQTTPAVPGLAVDFTDTSGDFVRFTGGTNPSGFVSTTIQGIVERLPYWAPEFIYATSAAVDDYDAATSNTVELDLNRHPSSVTLTATDFLGNPTINTIDAPHLHIRVAVATCDGSIGVQQFQAGLVIATYGGGQASMVSNPDGSRSCGADYTLGLQPVGVMELVASYNASWANLDSDSGTVDVPITLIATNTALSVSTNPVEAGTPTQLIATVTTPKGFGFVEGRGTVTFFDGATDLGTTPLGQTTLGNDKAPLIVSFATVGTHEIHATWNGITTASPSTSPDVPITVATDVVDATGVGLSASTLYPVVDGYGDTVGIEGQLGEPASLAITITNVATHAVVGTIASPNRGPGGYSIAWDGRTVSSGPFVVAHHGAPLPVGELVPAGTYRVTQVLTDTLGAQLTVSTNVVVSLKKIYWYTGTTTLRGNQYTAKGGVGETFSSSSSYSGGYRINLPGGPPGPWGALGYQFSLPSATEYASISFGVQGKGTSGAFFGLQDRQLGTWPSGKPWVIDDFSLITLPGRYGWTTFAGDPSENRIGRTVRGTVFLANDSVGHYDVAQVRLTYRYGVLR